MYRRFFYSVILCMPVALAAAGLSDSISTILLASESLSIQLILSVLLGLLLSLTPCIYPMIPITIGILQTNSGNSLLQNGLRALAYTCGIATTFALLGLLSAFTGTLFGSFMASPIVIIPMVILLLYLSGAMIGLYDMYIPRLLQQSHHNKGGSLLAAFTFGAASGTIASPCLSPGLVLLLSIVSTTGNPVTGFLLLFAFGIGLSIPLLVIGTFSSSLHILPHAGMWMVYIKQFFGLLMIGMCLYLLKPLMKPKQLAILGIIVYMVVALAIIIKQYLIHKKTRSLKIQVRTIIFCAVISAWMIFKRDTPHKDIHVAWCTQYTEAQQKALAEKKNILVEVNAPYCTICSAIEDKFFCEQAVCSALGNCVPVKINGADSSIEAHEQLKKQHNIIGAPTLLLINPETGEELARWGSELYDASVDEFAEQLKRY